MANNNPSIKALNAKDHTTGSIIRSIFAMGLPSMIGFGLGNIYDLIDMYWMSRLGPEPVAAITILSPFLWVIHSANHIVGVGSVAIISRRYGEKKYEETELAICETLVLKWLAAISIGFIGYLLAPYIMTLLGAKGEVIDMGITYGRIIFIGLGFNFATYSIFTAMRGVANPNIAMTIMLSLSGLNMILDPFMIFGWWIFPEMGLAGAAWASNISYAVAFTSGLVIFLTGNANVPVRPGTFFKIRWATMMKIIKIGAPSALGQISFSLARTIIMPMIALFGTGVVAAYGVTTRISSLGIMLLVGIGLGLSALIGHNMGANKKERARHTANQALLLSVGIMIAIGIITFIFAEFFMRLFFDDPEIIGYGVVLMRILALGMPFLGIHLTIENVYGGVGQNIPPMIMNMIHAWVLEIPAVYACVNIFKLGPEAVWWSIVAASVVAATAFYIYFRRGDWLKVKV